MKQRILTGPVGWSIFAAITAALVVVSAAPGADLPPGLAVRVESSEAIYTSSWLKVAFSLQRPAITFLSVDATGTSRHARNLVASPAVPKILIHGAAAPLAADCTAAVEGNVVRYTGVKFGDCETASFSFTVQPKSIAVTIDREISRDYNAVDSSPLDVLFDATVTPVSPLGRILQGKPGKLQFPVLLHFPDWGSLLVRCGPQGAEETTWDFSLLRDFKPITPGAVANWRKMTPEERENAEKVGNRRDLCRGDIHIGPQQIRLALHDGFDAGKQRGGKRRIELTMNVTAIYPEAALVDADPKLIGVKRAWLNIFGFRPDLASLANNSTGDTCQFCLHIYADQACYTPPLFDDFTALDLVRTTLDRYFDGFTGYCDWFQDVAPSTIIAAWDYATAKPDPAWLKRRIGAIEKYAERMIAMDLDGDGLCESERFPTNWWDCVYWNWKDAYSSALSFRAFRCVADLERRLGDEVKANRYQQRADQIKAVYYRTFFNPKTGVLAGWRAKDGTLNDRHFLFVNGIAIAYGVIDRPEANAILDRLQAKIKQVGLRNFRYGLPGNLEPIPYDVPFQVYENGGATGSMAYYYVQALYTAGRNAEAEAIFAQMLEGYGDGTFQNGIGKGGDWKEWNGTPCGYEGLLTDAYYPLTVLITGRLGRGTPIP